MWLFSIVIYGYMSLDTVKLDFSIGGQACRITRLDVSDKAESTLADKCPRTRVTVNQNLPFCGFSTKDRC